MIFESTIQKANLIMKLRSMGISSKKVLSAIEKIPREIFLPSNFTDYAYEITLYLLVLNRQLVSHI